jgi:hypothetical protein
MQEESFFLKAAKCEFEKRQVEYLGLILDKDTIEPDPVKIDGLKTWPHILKTVSEVCSTLGLLNYHQAFVPGFSHIVKPLNRIINILTTEPILTHPDPEKPFELEVDASDYAIGTILFQRDK